MFDGVPEQLRRFINSPAPPSVEARTLPFPMSFASFDTHHHRFLDPITTTHHKNGDCEEGINKEDDNAEFVSPVDHQLRRMDHDDVDLGGGHKHSHHRSWSSDEILALLRFRSTMETLFPEFIWEHVSRKLGDLGFRRTAEECKNKFEEEGSRYFNPHENSNSVTADAYNNKSNYRMFSELGELYHHHPHHHQATVSISSENDGEDKNRILKELTSQGNVQRMEEQDVLDVENDDMSLPPQSRKNKRKRGREKFEMLKGFFEGFVRNMINLQEEMHKKILDDMLKREEESIAREEELKRQETERANKEVEIRANEQAIASDRNSTIIKFINKFGSLNNEDQSPSTPTSSTTQSSSSLVLPQNPDATLTWNAGWQTKIATIPQMGNLCSSPDPLSESSGNPSFLPAEMSMKINYERNDIGKRWPRDEVVALINIRCSLDKNTQDQNREGSGSSGQKKAPPLWERISQKMLELGYRRSARRCKEKWENINKYFRKTKDANKKRSVESRTCPYFHHLSTLYSQGSPGASKAGGFDKSTTDTRNNTVQHQQDPGFDFEY